MSVQLHVEGEWCRADLREGCDTIEQAFIMLWVEIEHPTLGRCSVQPRMFPARGDHFESKPVAA
jgi:hypothetical protein